MHVQDTTGYICQEMCRGKREWEDLSAQCEIAEDYNGTEAEIVVVQAVVNTMWSGN